jgi:Tfp pilus assembly protein PilP
MRIPLLFAVVVTVCLGRVASAGQTPAPAPATGAGQAKPASGQAQPSAPATPATGSQTPAPAKPATGSQAPPAAPPATAASTPPMQESYTYRAEGRRDPFLSLVGAGTEPRLTSRRGEGPSGMTIGEISVRGIMQSRGALVAMIQGPDNKTYIVHQGDKLLDGTIKTITPQGLIVIQEVNDPLSLVKQREVRKLLRSLEDAKE